MGYRFYTSREFAKLNEQDKRRQEKREKLKISKYEVQDKLRFVLNKVPEEKRQFANFLCNARLLSVKQLAAAQRFYERAIAL